MHHERLMPGDADVRPPSLSDRMRVMEQTSLCAFGGGVPLPSKNAIQHFEAELKDDFKP
jgi:NADH:ubiquinone oxidoreductase subunit F (NADH-binding)